ncbi:hypothetical protein [Streptomyces luteireticuli]|uniref:Lsr2 DNA-binding domain-containing protein n=1 Tax=Streptomyces luteireticuli TaxID=173858 RepID=A0ABN0YR09_9ACTN
MTGWFRDNAATRGRGSKVSKGLFEGADFPLPKSIAPLVELAERQGWSVKGETSGSYYTDQLELTLEADTEAGAAHARLVWHLQKGRFTSHTARCWVLLDGQEYKPRSYGGPMAKAQELIRQYKVVEPAAEESAPEGAPKIRDVVITGRRGSERADVWGHVYQISFVDGMYLVDWVGDGRTDEVADYVEGRPALKRAILADVIKRGPAGPLKWTCAQCGCREVPAGGTRCDGCGHDAAPDPAPAETAEGAQQVQADRADAGDDVQRAEVKSAPVVEPAEVPSWAADWTPTAVVTTDRDWWYSYAQWTLGTLNARKNKGVCRAAVQFARLAEQAGWSVVLRAGNHDVDDETSVGVWEVEATGRCHDNEAGGVRDVVLSVMWSQKRAGGRWEFDSERSVAEIGGRVLTGIVTLEDYEHGARVVRPVQPEPAPVELVEPEVGSAPVAEPASGETIETAQENVSNAAPGWRTPYCPQCHKGVLDAVSGCCDRCEFADAEAARAGSLPPVESVKLADGWWQYSYGTRKFLAVHLPNDLAQGRLATLCFLIVDESGGMVGRSFGVPGDGGIRWYAANPGTSDPGIRWWLDMKGEGTPLPPMTDDERAFMAAGPQQQTGPKGKAVAKLVKAPKSAGPKVRDILFRPYRDVEAAELLGHTYEVDEHLGEYTVHHIATGDEVCCYLKGRPAMKRAILEDAVKRGECKRGAVVAVVQPEPVAPSTELEITEVQPELEYGWLRYGQRFAVGDVVRNGHPRAHLDEHGRRTGVVTSVSDRSDGEQLLEVRWGTNPTPYPARAECMVHVPVVVVERDDEPEVLPLSAAPEPVGDSADVVDAELVDDDLEEREPEGLELDGDALAEWLDGLTEEERQAIAERYPVRWLYPEREGDAPRVVNLFCGCGGACVGLRRVLGADVDMVCIDNNADAVATQQAAGCTAIQADVTTLDPGHPALRYTRGLIVTPPCIDYTQAGKGLGNLPENIRILCDAFDDAREAGGIIPLSGMPGEAMTYKSANGVSWAEIRGALDGYTGKTGGLMLEVAVWSLGLQLAGAPLEWVAVEQSSKLPEEIRNEVWADFQLAGWGMAEWTVRDAADYGSPSHRVRSLLVARRDGDSGVTMEPSRELVTLASEATGLPEDLEVVTRGKRKTSGGNAFVMGRVVPAVTGKVRSFDVGSKGGRFTIEQIAKLVMLPGDHPLVGSRTSQCQQAADVVVPGVGAALLGVALGIPWMPSLEDYLAKQYPDVHGADTPENDHQDDEHQAVEPKEEKRSFARPFRLGNSGYRWGVECDRHGPMAIRVEGEYEYREDAEDYARLHASEHLNRDDFLTPEEIDEAVALAFSDKQLDILKWAHNGDLMEDATSFYVPDGGNWKPKVFAAKRVLTMWAAGFLGATDTNDGHRRCIGLSAAGQDAWNLWHRARRQGLVEPTDTDNDFGVTAAQIRSYKTLKQQAKEQESAAGTEKNPEEGAAGVGVEDSTLAEHQAEDASTPVVVFIVSKNTRPTKLRVLWSMTRAEAMRFCTDDRAAGRNFGLHWTADPGTEGEDWEFVKDNGRYDALLAEIGIVPSRTWQQPEPEETDEEQAARYILEHEAKDLLPKLRWSRELHEVAVLAGVGRAWRMPSGTGYRQGPEHGKRIKAELVELLKGSGYLLEDDEGRVWRTVDGRRVVEMANACPELLVPHDQVMKAVQKARRKRAHGHSVDLLPILPGGEVERLRQAAMIAQMKSWCYEGIARKRQPVTAADAEAWEQWENEGGPALGVPTPRPAQPKTADHTKTNQTEKQERNVVVRTIVENPGPQAAAGGAPQEIRTVGSTARPRRVSAPRRVLGRLRQTLPPAAARVRATGKQLTTKARERLQNRRAVRSAVTPAPTYTPKTTTLEPTPVVETAVCDAHIAKDGTEVPATEALILGTREWDLCDEHTEKFTALLDAQSEKLTLGEREWAVWGEHVEKFAQMLVVVLGEPGAETAEDIEEDQEEQELPDDDADEDQNDERDVPEDDEADEEAPAEGFEPSVMVAGDIPGYRWEDARTALRNAGYRVVGKADHSTVLFILGERGTNNSRKIQAAKEHGIPCMDVRAPGRFRDAVCAGEFTGGDPLPEPAKALPTGPTDREKNQRIREWGQHNGWPIKRGRLPEELRNAYEKAHQVVTVELEPALV